MCEYVFALQILMSVIRIKLKISTLFRIVIELIDVLNILSIYYCMQLM